MQLPEHSNGVQRELVGLWSLVSRVPVQQGTQGLARRTVLKIWQSSSVSRGFNRSFCVSRSNNVRG